jgi:hypothetical protein
MHGEGDDVDIEMQRYLKQDLTGCEGPTTFDIFQWWLGQNGTYETPFSLCPRSLLDPGDEHRMRANLQQCKEAPYSRAE